VRVWTPGRIEFPLQPPVPPRLRRRNRC
jgi:hypothetical protein